MTRIALPKANLGRLKGDPWGAGRRSRSSKGEIVTAECENLSMSMLFDKWSVWDKAWVVEGMDPNVTRKDDFGKLIDFSAHGMLTERGWEKHHIIPRALGGSDELFNLRPLHWFLNRAKGDTPPTLAEILANADRR